MATMELDVAHLSSFCSLPQSSITTLLDEPTAELVQTLLANISTKAHEFDEAKSQRLRLSVELENAVRGGESKTRVLKDSIEKGQKEAAELRQRLHSEEQSRIATESELEELKTSTSSSVSEIASLKTRILSLESSNRDTLSLLESKTTAYDRLAEELSSQHQKTVELRREVSNLEQLVQSANASASASKFHEQGLQQEIEQLKRSNDWLNSELKTKSADYTKHRKEKGLRIAELTRQNDEFASTIDSLNRTESHLRKRLEDVTQKADDSLSRIQQMQEEASKKDEAFKVELDAANRLAELMKNSANTEKVRRQDLQDQLESIQEDAAEQIERISAEIDTEHREREAAEQKIIELEVQVERLEADVSTWQNQASLHGSSQPGINGYASDTPGRGGVILRGYSPSPSLKKGGLSITQLVSDYNDLKGELDAEKRRNAKLSCTIDEMIQDLETRQPEVEELRADHSRLELDVAEMSTLVDIIATERDLAIKTARKQEGQVEAKIKEGEVLRQQLRDLSSQVKVLLMEVHLRDKGFDDIDAEKHLELERLAKGQIDDDDPMDGLTDTDRFISQNLVTFKNLAQLQEQNNNLIKVTREVGQKMEREEAARVSRDMEDLQQKYEQCKDEIKSLITQSQSYIRERDMFRRMLAHRGQLPPEGELASMFGDSIDGRGSPATPTRASIVNSIEKSPTSRDLADYAKLLKDMQSHFDAYRQEAAIDRSTLKEQVDNLSRTNGELRSEVGRSSSQVTLAHERYEMLRANYSMLKAENDELQKRSQFFSDSAAKQDLRTQQVVEDLVEAKGLADSMRNELAILKAEKDWWKSVEKRLTDDNETLSNERARLNSLNASLQNLLNEKEHSDTEARRRLLTQVEGLEKELQAAKRKLSEEVEENKRATLRREFDQQHNQKRIDDLVTSLGVNREDLVATRTTRDHLQARVDEITIELRNSEERAQMMQPISNNRQGGSAEGDSQDTISGDESSLTKEQALRLQVSELRNDLELCKTELENVRSQVEQYKAISQSSEEQLQNLNETQDMFRQETDKAINDKTDKIRLLEGRIDDLASELSSTASELSELRAKDVESEHRLKEQESLFKAEITQLKDQDERHAAAAQYHQEDLKVQAEIAQQAQQNYENELVKHAEAAKALQSVRGQLNEVRVQVVELRTEADSARTSLAQNEESWVESRDRYQREIDDVKQGKENLVIQNNRLHQQLETLSGQISKLQKRASNDEPENVNDNSTKTDFDNLQEVIKYLRREKEIVDVQLELSTQEAKRLKQQLDYTQSQLDDTRLKLNQQRRLEEDHDRTAMNHNKLMETINELNTFRESSVTLRNETRQAQASLATKVKQVEELIIQIEPLQAEIRELKNEKETQAGEIRLLQENSDRWQQRAQNILQKYDRVDPVELEALKEKIQALETERDTLISSKQTLQEEVESIPTKITQAQDQGNERFEELRSRLTEQFKTRSKNLTAIIKDKDIALQAASKDKSDFEQQLQALRYELEEARAQRDNALEKSALVQVNKIDANEHSGSEEGQVDEERSSRSKQEVVQALQEKLNAAEAKITEEASRFANLQNQANAFQVKITELENQMAQMQQTLDNANAELAHLRHLHQQQQVNSQSDGVSEEQVEQLHQDLVRTKEAAEAAQREADDLKAAASINASLTGATIDESSTSIADQLSERVEAIRLELDTRHKERVDQVEEQLRKRSEAMKNQLTKKLVEGKDQVRLALTAEHEQVLAALKVAHEQEIEKLNARHQDELAELRRNEESRFANFRNVSHSERSATNNDEKDTANGDSRVSGMPWEPTEAEARELVAKNNTVRGIVMKNIATKIKEAKDTLSLQLKEEHERQLAERLREQQDKANITKEQAVMMEGKRNLLKLSMAENKARGLQPKIDIVRKAAQETPQRPVSEVWSIAMDAKPPPPVAPQSQTDATKAQTAPSAGTFGQPTPLGPSSSAIQDKTQSTPPPPSMETFSSQGVSPQRPNPFAANNLNQSQGFQRPNPPVPASDFQISINNSQPSNPQPTSGQNTLPMKPPQNGGAPHFSGNASVGAARGLQQSGLPVARGGSIRGGPNPRGRGQGIGRGVSNSIDTNRAQGHTQGRNSPTSGMLSGGARQFVPQGNKRPREDGQDGQHSSNEGNGKRVRGGYGGS